jgi:hypothetical protein
MPEARRIGGLTRVSARPESHQSNDSHKLLVAALQIWLTNIIVFGLAYCELDRGGPGQRAKLPRAELPPADFRFSQDEDADAVDEVAASSSGRVDWVPVFADYLYVSVTNSSAFSPTDTMPLSSRAKATYERPGHVCPHHLAACHRQSRQRPQITNM